MSFQVELLAKFQKQSFSAISKAGYVEVLERRLVVVPVEDDFSTAFFGYIQVGGFAVL